MADKLAQELIAENNGDCNLLVLAQRVEAKITAEHLAEKVLEPRHVAQIVTTTWSRKQTTIRKKCEQKGDFFRPQLLVPTAQKVLSRLGTGGILTLTGYQTEINRKAEPARKILEHVADVVSYCGSRIPELVKHPGWNVTQVEIECFGYKWREEDAKPFSLDLEGDLILWDDGEIDGDGED
jgi:hypothetical protein